MKRRPKTLEIFGFFLLAIAISFPIQIMEQIASKSKRFTWIDHHISAIKEYQEQKGETYILGVLDNTISACEGTWNYLFPDEPMPHGIKLLGEYDTWRNTDKKHWEEDVLPFQFGFRYYCNSVETFKDNIFWDNTFVPCVIEKGNVILKYQAQINELNCKKSFEIEFEGLRAICLNGGGFNSDVFKSVYDESKHDIMMPFQFDGKQWTISLYTTKDIDLSVIAKAHGGGGHKKACGFQVKDISTIFKQTTP